MSNRKLLRKNNNFEKKCTSLMSFYYKNIETTGKLKKCKLIFSNLKKFTSPTNKSLNESQVHKK